MYLQIGTEKFISTEEIIGIFDLDNTTVVKTTREYLNAAEKNGDTDAVGFDLPKSFIVSEKDGERTVFISPYSTSTIFKRAE